MTRLGSEWLLHRRQQFFGKHSCISPFPMKNQEPLLPAPTTWTPIVGANAPQREIGANAPRTEEGVHPTLQEALRLSEHSFRTVLLGSSTTVAHQDRDLRYIWMYQASGQPADELIGRADPSVFEQQNHAADLTAVKRQVLETGIGSRKELTLQVHGESRSFDLIVEPLTNEEGTVLGVTTVAFDITDRKRTERALKDAARHKDDFLAMLGHELRNPLAPIQNCLSLLRNETPLASTSHRVLDIMERQVRHLSRLVDDLLDMERIARGRITLSRAPIDLIELTRETINDHEELFKERGIGIDRTLSDEPVNVLGDRTRLAQALTNILQNAAKFTPRDGRVVVSAYAEVGSAVAVIDVRDTGIGMSPATLASVFEAFGSRKHRERSESSGLGLGLSLAHSLVSLHGGTIRAMSDGPDQGAEFQIRLPRETGAHAAAQGESRQPAGIRRRILIIEDNHDAAESLKLLLEMDGHEVRVAHDGASGLEAVGRETPGVVICDIALPGELTGYDFAKTLRATHPSDAVMLIALSGFGQARDQRRARLAGFDVHLNKPVNLARLRQILASDHS